MENKSNEINSKKLLSPKLDVVFQALFGEVGSEDITIKFLEAILNQKINSIDLTRNPILRREDIDDKLGILDIVAMINDNQSCNIEMQVVPQNHLVERLLFYWGRLYTKQIKSGDTYNVLQKTIVIMIANFKITGLEHLEYHTSWKVIEEKYRKTILTDKLEIRIIELPKIINSQNENDELLDWLFFLDNPQSERVMLKMKDNKELQKATKKLEEISSDEHLQRIAELRYKAILEENTARADGLEEGLQQGLQQGIQQGIQQTTLDIALKLLKNGMTPKFITEITGLSFKELEELRKEHNL